MSSSTNTFMNSLSTTIKISFKRDQQNPSACKRDQFDGNGPAINQLAASIVAGCLTWKANFQAYCTPYIKQFHLICQRQLSDQMQPLKQIAFNLSTSILGGNLARTARFQLSRCHLRKSTLSTQKRPFL